MQGAATTRSVKLAVSEAGRPEGRPTGLASVRTPTIPLLPWRKLRPFPQLLLEYHVFCKDVFPCTDALPAPHHVNVDAVQSSWRSEPP